MVDRPAQIIYQYPGASRDFGDNYVELLEHLSQDLHCSYWIDDLSRHQEPNIIIGFGDEEMDYQWAVDKKADVEALRIRLQQLGLQPGTAALIQCFSE